MFLYSIAHTTHFVLSLASSPAEFSTGKKYFILNAWLKTILSESFKWSMMMHIDTTVNNNSLKYQIEWFWVPIILLGYFTHKYRGAIEQFSLKADRKSSRV